MSRKVTRRSVLALGAGAFVFAAVPYGRGRRPRLFRRRLPLMGTIAEIAVVHDGNPHAALDAAFAELRFVDETMSRFLATSDVGRLNHAGPGVAVTVGEQTALVLRHALSWAERSAGAFDPCLGRATELWDVTRRRTPPAAHEVRRFAGRRLYGALDLDGRRAVVSDGDVAVDLGGIAKGHAVDRAARALRERGVAHALVNVGGDLVALGASEDGDAWRVGVVDGDDPGRLTRTLMVRDEAIATSGDYERGFDHAGQRYHHLLDTATASPRTAKRHSLTVVAADCMTADAAATACFGLEDDGVGRMLGGSGARVA
ncbi:MAG: FAD:protein FMN transferase [Planctomycetota bacterium]|nr:FAD:protein FMN transferase [Planctomycetota bacterium]